MPRFKVIKGSHEQEGQTFQAGDIVETSYNLVALFPQKFEKLEGDDWEEEMIPSPAASSSPLAMENENKPTPEEPVVVPAPLVEKKSFRRRSSRRESEV